MEDHVKAVLSKFPGAKSRGKSIAQRASRDARKETYQLKGGGSAKGARRRTFEKGNPNSEQDYKKDSDRLLDHGQNLSANWSRFQPKLLAYWEEGGISNPGKVPDLLFQCRLSCIPTLLLLGKRNRAEVISYFWDEHQGDANDYGMNRIKPEQQGKPEYMRNQLLANEKPKAERNIIQYAEQKLKALDSSKIRLPDRSDPFYGRSDVGGMSDDWTQKSYAHIYRTRVAKETAKEKLKGLAFFAGWFYQDKCIYTTFPPPPSKKKVINLWGEETKVDEQLQIKLLGQQRPDFFKWTNHKHEPIDQASKKARENKENAWFRKDGPAALDEGNYPSFYEELKEVGIDAKNDPESKRAIWRGQGHLNFNMQNSGFMLPALTFAAQQILNVNYIAGARDLTNLYGDKEEQRVNQFTEANGKPGQYVDKIGLLWPRKSNGQKMTEALRPAKLPNFPEQTQDSWVAENLPMDLIDYEDKHFGSVSYVLSNQRVACTCRTLGLAGGCQVMNTLPFLVPDGVKEDPEGFHRGDGDRAFGNIEPHICEYQEGLYPSAFTGAGTETVECIPNTKKYKGLDDKVN